MQIFSQDYPSAAEVERQSRDNFPHPFCWPNAFGRLAALYTSAIGHLVALQCMLRNGRMPEFEYADLEATLLGVQAVQARANRAGFRALGYDDHVLRRELAGAFEQVERALSLMIEERDAEPEDGISDDEDARQLDNRSRGRDLQAARRAYIS